MFCDEHGTLDHCPECVGEDMQKEITRLQSELTGARDDAERLRAQLSDMTGCACDAESLCKYHAMTTTSGRSIVLRKQAEAVDEVNRRLTTMSEDTGSRPIDSALALQYAASTAGDYAQRLHQQADDLDNV